MCGRSEGCIYLLYYFCSIAHEYFLSWVDTHTHTHARTHTELELPSLCNQLIELKVMDILTEILKQYTQVLEIQTHAIGMLGHILALKHLELEDSNLEPWLTLIYNAFINHGDAFVQDGKEHSLQEAGCRCLAQLLEVNPHLHAYIGDDAEAFQ